VSFFYISYILGPPFSRISYVGMVRAAVFQNFLSEMFRSPFSDMPLSELLGPPFSRISSARIERAAFCEVFFCHNCSVRGFKEFPMSEWLGPPFSRISHVRMVPAAVFQNVLCHNCSGRRFGAAAVFRNFVSAKGYSRAAVLK